VSSEPCRPASPAAPMSDAALCALVLVLALGLFVSDRVRHDLVALLALGASLVLGLVPPKEALLGFADPAVVAVAAILVVGRAVELSGLASGIARVAIPPSAPFVVRMGTLLCVAAVLSAFMNNIAALVITMPLAAEIARKDRLSPGATMMPLAFATILGGMTTLIGTPANLILSSVREEEFGTPLSFFSMTPVGLAVAAVGLVYLVLVGWRLLPVRRAAEGITKPPWRIFELTVPPESDAAMLKARLRSAGARIVKWFREADHAGPDRAAGGEVVLVASRSNQWTVAESAGLVPVASASEGDWVTARVVVAHGSYLIGQGYDAIATRSGGKLIVAAAGPRAARLKQPLAQVIIEAGDQLFIRGASEDLAPFLASARLLEVDRLDRVPIAPRRAIFTGVVFSVAVLAIVVGGLSPALAFLAAATVLVMIRLIPAEDVYRSIDWSVIVLLAAMIPVGHSFETSGAATMAASALGDMLAGLPLFVILATICSLTLLLSIFLNNVATAIIMGPLVFDTAALLGVAPDAALLAVLIGVSSDFLTPIGHQNNLLVMGPGGYRFTDYARMGAPLVVAVVLTTAATLTLLYGQGSMSH
jgi:di/tricarboxylate transporter